MKKTILFLLCLLAVSVSAWQQKPMLGQLVNWTDPLTSGVVGYWPMNEGSGNKVLDLSGNGNTGTLVADTHFVPGKFGRALDFDGTGDYATITPVDTSIYDVGSQGITVIIWARVDSVALADIAMHYGGSNYRCWRISVYLDTTRLYTYVDGALAFEWTTCDWAVGEWHQVAITVTHTLSTLYSDGIYRGSNVEDGAVQNSDVGVTLGAWYDGSANNLDGALDCLLIYNRALTAAEIRQLYQRGGDPLGMNREWGPMMYGGAPVPVFQNHYRRMRN